MLTEKQSKPLLDAIKQLGVLVQDFESVISELAQSSHNSSEKLDRSVVEATHKLKTLLNDSKAILQEHARDGINGAVQESIGMLKKEIQALCQRVDQSAAGINTASHRVTKQTKYTGWTALIGVGLGCVAFISFTLWYGWDKTTSLEELSRRYDQLEKSVKIREALDKLQMTWCDGKACIRLNRDAPRYEKNREYVLIEE